MTDHDWITVVNILPDGTEVEFEIREDLFEELMEIGSGIWESGVDGDG